MKLLVVALIAALAFATLAPRAAYADSKTMQQLEADVAQLQTDVSSLQGRVSNLQSQVSDLQTVNSSLQSQISGLQTTVTDLQTVNGTLQNEVGTLQGNPALTLGQYVSVVNNTVRGLKGPTVVFSGVNVQIESGSGQAVDTTGLGNLIIGYDDDSFNNGNDRATIDSRRTGSNNLIVGTNNMFTASGTIVGGDDNFTSANYASITGGGGNVASSEWSSVTGGTYNTASGGASSVNGGDYNTASGNWSSIGGGENQTESTDYGNIN